VTKGEKWLLGLGLIAVLGTAILLITAHLLSQRLEPYIRDQAIQYLRNHFDSDVDLGALHVRMPTGSFLKMLTLPGRGKLVRGEGEGISVRRRGHRDVSPIFVIKNFVCEVDLGTLLTKTKTVHSVTIDGMQINFPPKHEQPTSHSRPQLDSNKG
jgi:hypothetical protein